MMTATFSSFVSGVPVGVCCHVEFGYSNCCGESRRIVMYGEFEVGDPHLSFILRARLSQFL